MDDPNKTMHTENAQDETPVGEPATRDEKSVMAYAQEAFASAKNAAMDAAERAKAFVKEKADETDLDEKAADFAKKATETAKNAFDTAAGKTREFVEKNDLDDKARDLAQEVSQKAKSLGGTLGEKARTLVQDAKEFFDSQTKKD